MAHFTRAHLEYEKDENLKPLQVEMLMDWCKKQAHLPEITELQAILFLQSCYYSLETSKSTIDNYFTVKTHCPEFFLCPPEELLKATLATGFYGFIPRRTKKNEVVFVTKLLKTKVEDFHYVNILNLCVLSINLHLHRQGTAEGIHTIVDMTGVTLSHLTRLGLGTSKTFFYILQEALPIRVLGVHIINVTPVAEKLMALIKPFVKSELYNLISFHRNFDTLHRIIPKENLPKEFGGSFSNISSLHEEDCRLILENLDFFKSQHSQIVDESRRVGKAKGIDEIFGVEGSFKKLEID